MAKKDAIGEKMCGFIILLGKTLQRYNFLQQKKRLTPPVAFLLCVDEIISSRFS